MLWWLTGELLIATVIVVVAWRMRQYWLGGALVFLLWPLFSWLVPSQDSMMYALPFVLGVPAIVVWRGRALPPEEKSYLAEKYAFLLMACFLARGIGSRPKKRKSARAFSHSPNGISLGSVLMQVGKR